MAFSKSKSLNVVQKYIQRGQPDKAIKELETLIDVEPNDASLHIKIGDLFLRKGAKLDAKDAYNKAASLYLKEGFNNRAIATYKMVSRIDPTNLDVNVNIAELFEKQGLVGDALQQYKYVATMYDKQGNYEWTVKTLKKILELDPENPAAKIKLAEMHFKHNNKQEAYNIMTAVSAELKRKKQFNELLKAFEIFNDIDPQDRYIMKEIAKAYVLAGNPEEGLKKIQSAKKISPNDIGIALTLAETYTMLKRFDDAESIYCEMLRNDDKNYRAKFGLSKIFLQRDNVEEAVKELAPFYGKFEENGELNELAEFYYEAHKKKTDSIDILEKLAEIYRYFNNADKLVEIYEKLADVYEANSQNDKVEFLYQKIMQLNPGHEGAREFLERTNHELLGAFSAGSEVDYEAINEHLTEAGVYLKYGLYDQAKDHIDHVLKADKNNFDAHNALKDIYVAKGEKDKAINELFFLSELSLTTRRNQEEGVKLLNEIIRLDPDNRQVKQRLDNIGVDFVEAPSAPPPRQESHQEKFVEEFEGVELVIEEPEELKKTRAVPKSLKETLEEAEFYFSEGLYDDAKTIYKKIILDDPYNMIALERLEQIEQKSAPQKSAGAGDFGAGFDLSKELEDSLPDDLLRPASHDAPLDDSVETDNIFSQFKKGLEEHIDNKDYESHYNLGIAYKEMGLLDDSADEFKKALVADPAKVFECCTMLGLVSLETKRYDDAIKYFENIITKVDLPPEQNIGLVYELATAYKGSGQNDKALKHFNKIKEMDPNYRDVQQNIQLLVEEGDAEESDAKTKKKRKISYV